MYQSGIGFKKYKPKKGFNTKEKDALYIICEILIKMGSELIWLRVALESKNSDYGANNSW
jgi:hypothetical protein